MDILLNHSPICSLLYLGNTQGALKLFEERFDTLKENNCFSQCKLFVISLNFCIYNYILIKENNSLHQCCLANNVHISNALDLASLKKAGLETISKYAGCQDYLFEKFSHPEIKKAIQYIHAHMEEPLTLESVCEAINLNKCYFCTLFKTHTSKTFTQYLNEARIHAAKKLMSETQLTLHEIAFRCGFNSYSYFCTTFKKVAGLSPSEFLIVS